MAVDINQPRGPVLPAPRPRGSWIGFVLTAALAVILLADVIWNFAVVTTAPAEPSAFNDLLRLSSYALLAIAVWVPSMRDASEPLPEYEPRIPATARLALLAAGLVLPAATLPFTAAICDSFMGPSVAPKSTVPSVN